MTGDDKSSTSTLVPLAEGLERCAGQVSTLTREIRDHAVALQVISVELKDAARRIRTIAASGKT